MKNQNLEYFVNQFGLEETCKYLSTQLPVGIYIMNIKGDCVYANEKWLEIADLKLEEALGTGWINALHPDDKLKTIEHWHKSVKFQTHLNNEYRFMKKNGEITWVEGSAKKVFNPKNELLGYFGTTINITDRKNAEKELIKAKEQAEISEKYIQSFINKIGDPIFVKDDQSRLLLVNDAFCTIFGLSRDKIIGKTLAEEVTEKQREQFLRIDKQVITDGQDNVTEELLTVRNGPTLTISTRKTRYIDENGKRFLIGLIYDITDRKKAIAEIEQSREELRLLADHLQTIREEERAHIAREVHDELSQQLTALKMDVSWIRKKILPEEVPLQKKLEAMISLIDDTMTKVRFIGNSLRSFILDDFGLVDALEFQSSEFEKQHSIHCHFNSPIRELDIDKNVALGIFRIYQETLTNIARHSQAINVTTHLKRRNEHLLLTIHDNGKGFDPEEIKNKKTLGFVGMKERAFMMSSKINIETKKGKGTTITLEVPYKMGVAKLI